MTYAASSKPRSLCRSLLLKFKVFAASWSSEPAAIVTASKLFASYDEDEIQAGIKILKALNLTEEDIAECRARLPKYYVFLDAFQFSLQSRASWKRGAPLNERVDQDHFRPGYLASSEATEILSYSDQFLERALWISEVTDLNNVLAVRWYEALAEVMTQKEAEELAQFISGKGANPWSFKYVVEPGPDYEYYAPIDHMVHLFSKIPRALHLLRLWEQKQPMPTYQLSRSAASKLVSEILFAEYPRRGLGTEISWLGTELNPILKSFSAAELEEMIRARFKNSKEVPTFYHPSSKFAVDYVEGTSKFFDELSFQIDFEKVFAEAGVSKQLIYAWQLYRKTKVKD